MRQNLSAFGGALGVVPPHVPSSAALLSRPPHIHLSVRAPGYRRLCTQLYFPDRLAPGEFDELTKADPAHFDSALHVSPAMLVRPKRRDEIDVALRGSPPTRWAAAFNFELDRA